MNTHETEDWTNACTHGLKANYKRIQQDLQASAEYEGCTKCKLNCGKLMLSAVKQSTGANDTYVTCEPGESVLGGGCEVRSAQDAVGVI